MLAIDHFRTTALRAAGDLPLLSSALQRALALLAQGDDVSVNELASAIEQDVVIASTTLSIANSVMYIRTGQVSTVKRAIARLGIVKTRNLLLGLSVTRAFRKLPIPSPWSSARFNSHSLATAILADQLARTVPTANAEWAFMAGLMHESGLLLIAAGLPQQFKSILAASSSDVELVQQEKLQVGFSHFQLGAELIGRWNFPLCVQEAARFCESTGFPFVTPMPLGAIVKSASLLADSHKITIFDWNQENLITGELLEALQITSPEAFLQEFESGFQELVRAA